VVWDGRGREAPPIPISQVGTASNLTDSRAIAHPAGEVPHTDGTLCNAIELTCRALSKQRLIGVQPSVPQGACSGPPVANVAEVLFPGIGLEGCIFETSPADAVGPDFFLLLRPRDKSLLVIPLTRSHKSGGR
jgi:hypothetical protein